MHKEKIDTYLMLLMKKHQVDMVGYTIIDHHQIIASNALDIPFLFQACSFSKCLTAYAVLDLVAQHKITLDHSVNQQLMRWKIPKSAYSEMVTVRQCLTMTSGLSYRESNFSTLQEVFDNIISSVEPGKHYAYTGAGYMVVQQLIEEITQCSFIEYMNEIILKRLEMTQSAFGADILTTASGGLWSTPLDMAKFILEVEDFSLSFMRDGQGENLNFRKNGHNTGYHHELLIFPNTGQGVVIMTNSATGITLINEFIDEMARKFQWPAYSPDFNEL